MTGFLIRTMILFLAVTACAAESEEELLLYRHADLELARERIRAGGAVAVAAYEDLLDDARKWLRVERFSVVDKKLLPESGDRHDYLSLAPYWWPNQKSGNGLPYVRKDGKTNPESKDEDATDKERLLDFTGAVQTLALAWYFSGEKAYAEKAGEMLRAWFLDKETRMNPHLESAQVVRGRGPTRSGVIEGRAFFRVMDASWLLDGAPGWSHADKSGTRAWFAAFLEWLLESEMARAESESTNNHGTWYDAQVMGMALFVGREDAFDEAFERWQGRIDLQLAGDGSQPLEMERTLSLDYSLFNLVAHFYALRLAERSGKARGKMGEDRFRKALGFLRPALYGESAWIGKQIKPLKVESLLELVRLAERVCPGLIDEGQVVALAPGDEEARGEIRESRFQLLLPRFDTGKRGG